MLTSASVSTWVHGRGWRRARRVMQLDSEAAPWPALHSRWNPQKAGLAALLASPQHTEALPLVSYAERMSVEHYTFPGQIPGYENVTDNISGDVGPPATVVLHLFVKCVLQPSGREVLCAGWGFVEATEGVPILHRHIAQPEAIRNWRPRIEIRTGVPNARRIYPLTVAKADDETDIRPFHFEGELPLSLRDQVPEIRVDDWPRFHYFRNLEAPEVPPPHATPEKTLLLLSSFYYEPPRGSYALAAQLLVHHVRHHVGMGLAGEIVYVQHHYVPELLKHAELVDYVSRGQLQIIVWDSFPKYDTPGFPTTDQPLQYSHALLENWGRGLRILVADVDEFLVTPHRGNVSTVLACARGADQARLRRFDVMCSGERCPGDGQSEVDLWTSPEPHPLRHYNLIDRSAMSTFFGRLPKVIVSPERVRHFYVHEGVVVAGGADVEVREGCAFLAHVLCLYSKRSDKVNFELDTSWHWLFENLD
ncbi:hypothetical protein KFL_000940330 [Klebsormidium nitens]|uniref:Glycosyltransferase family 92 protein n=1 Tax=Klebsormidium nitens TaxID=105231 RepID=A0A1Y1HTH2_KLENI|nr:hypothetical protein KFL_000940330 [Klebsormidium nitens]|eukprot:GAQ81924.1 hypothetical protein KFL_000940330 [Klebsormidium nitens]